MGYRLPSTSPKLPGKIKLVSFTDFCPYTVDLDYYKELRAEFDIHEWIDILLGAIDYNASGYAKDAFLKLTNDAFLWSELTEQYYEASAKDNTTCTSE